MIQLADISLNFGPQILFDHVSLSIPPQRHMGLVGQNGSGKSTLLKMIAGMQEPSEGHIVIPSHWTVAYLPQEITYNRTQKPLLEEVLTVFEHIFDIENRMRLIEHELSEHANPSLLEEYDHLQERFHRLNGYQAEAKAKEVLTGLGFRENDFSRAVAEFSGGWQMRIALAKILLDEPDCLLLDEPTNHMDLETMVWLENLLSRYSGTLVIVSHDRYFLDKLVGAIIEVENGKATLYQGNYTEYEIRKEERLEHELAVLRNQERKIAHMEQFIERFRYKASKARQVQSRIKQLSKISLHEPDIMKRRIHFSFAKCERCGDPVIAASGLGFSYPGTPVFKNTNFEIRRGEKVALLGPNGAGKSTLMKLINGQLEPEEGELKTGYNMQTAYFAQQHLEQLDLSKTVQEEVWSAAAQLPRNEIRGLLGRFLFSGEDVDKPVSVLSGGEKSRLVLMKLLLSKANFLILDEPTNHLDMQSKEILAEALDEFEGSVLIVSHDRFFLDMLVTKVVYFRNGTAKEYLGNYSEYEEKILLQEPAQENVKSSPALNERKAQKRREAEERQQRYKALKGVRKEIDKLEKVMDALEIRMQELDKLFISPDFKALSVREMHERAREHEKIREQLKETEERWLLLQEKIESV
jgi:ATP-binding cassette, subfamily F, member 3